MYQIFCKTLTGKTITLDVQSSYTISKVKELIMQKEHQPKQTHILVFDGKNLDDGKTLSYYKIKKLSTIQSMGRIRGGDGPTFMFNSLEKKTKLQFAKERSPKYRIVLPGLNLQTKCRNKNCQAYNQVVWIRKGFGQFNIGKQIYLCKCPSCNQKTQEATNIGYYKTFIKVTGKQDNSNDIVEWQETVNQNNFTTFINNDEDLRKWNFLEITTERID